MPAATRHLDPATAARDHLLSLQLPDGFWEGEMVWCTMITSQYVIVHHVLGQPLDARTRDGILRHFRVTRTDSGAWGLHPESGGYVFTTALAYVALRLLGLPPDDPLVAPARRWLRSHDVLAIPAWGKYWLAVVGLYGWDGAPPCPPELFLLPEALPFHPTRFYCHTRNIYAALSYLYGRRAVFDPGPIVHALRAELYEQPYADIDFAAHRNAVAATDLFVPASGIAKLGLEVMRVAEHLEVSSVRARALDVCFERLMREQEQSRHQGISPVNALLNLLAVFDRDPQHPELTIGLDAIEAWRFEDEAEGVRFAGARSQTWDTAFVLQALLDGPELHGIPYDSRQPTPTVAAFRRGYARLVAAQQTEELEGYAASNRQPALGGWCFSDGVHRWPVSDCTAESLTAILAAHAVPGLIPPRDQLSPERIGLGVEFLLLRQNDDGGFGSYERRRAPKWLEQLNITEMYGNCMVEASYLECTASAAGALARALHDHPNLPACRDGRATQAHARAIEFIRAAQLPDGRWPAAWGIQYTYGIFHAVKALRESGVPQDDPAFLRAIDWLRESQRKDGAWGEHHEGSREGRYIPHRDGQVVMTSWALLALLELLPVGDESIRRAIRWLESRQLPDGSYPSEAVNGVFFGSAMLDYRLYKAYFPTWALGKFARLSR